MSLLVNEEAERAVLGSCLVGSMTNAQVLPIDTCLDAGCQTDWFSLSKHRMMWEAMSAEHMDGKVVDLVTIGALTDDHEFIDRLVDGTPTAGNVSAYLEILEDMQKRRTIVSISEKAIDQARKMDIDPLCTASETSDSLDEISSTRERKTMREHMEDNKRVLMDAIAGIFSGLPLPWKKFSDRTGGIQVKSVCPLVGRDGKGKSGASAQIADYWAGENIPTLYFSMEDDPRRTLLRMAGCRKWFSARDFEHGSSMIGSQRVMYTKSQANAKERLLDEYTDWLEGRAVEVIDGDFTGEQIHAEIKAFRRRHGLKALEKIGVIIDGFKDVDASGGDSTTAEEKHTSKQIQKAAKRCNAAIIVVSHITKIADDVAIIKENIKGSGTQFQGARQVLIFQDAGLEQIIDDNHFILSATKANFAHGGSAVLRRDEVILKYQEL
jgi:hypothetical protein